MSSQQAMWRGAVTALVVALPAAVFNQLLVAAGDIESGSPVTVIFWVLILFGATAGGWAVVRLSPAAALAFAAGAGAICYVIVQGVGIARRLLAGEPLSWVAFPLLALMMATAAMAGGMIGRRWNSQVGHLDDAR